MNRLILIFLLCIATPALQAQQAAVGLVPLGSRARPHYTDTVWTVRGATVLGPQYKKWKFDFVLDARQTLVSDTRVRLAGLRLGLEFRRVHRFGVGFYWMGDPVRLNSLSAVDANITDASLNLGYASLFYERIMFFHRKWEWSLTGHLGSGTIEGTYTLASGETGTFRRNVRPVEASTTLYYHLTYFMSIGTGVGYRYMRSTPEEIRPVYNAPVGILRLRIKLIKMASGLRNRDVREAY